MARKQVAIGGKRAGRKPGRYGVKVTLATRVSEDVKAFLGSTGNASQTVDDTVRKTKAFREWVKLRTRRQTQRGIHEQL